MGANKPNTDWLSIEKAYRVGIVPTRQIANDSGVSEAMIRARAKRSGWVRETSEDRRARVIAQSSALNMDAAVKQTIAGATAEDIIDMSRGLRIHRECLISLEVVSKMSTDPREIKQVVEATSSAIESIRKIRGLDPVTQVAGTINNIQINAQQVALVIDKLQNEI